MPDWFEELFFDYPVIPETIDRVVQIVCDVNHGVLKLYNNPNASLIRMDNISTHEGLLFA